MSDAYRADFGAATPDELAAVADSLRTVLAAQRSALADPAYNLVLRSAIQPHAAR